MLNAVEQNASCILKLKLPINQVKILKRDVQEKTVKSKLAKGVRMHICHSTKSTGCTASQIRVVVKFDCTHFISLVISFAMS